MWKSTKQRIGIILWKDISEYPWEDVLSWGGGVTFIIKRCLSLSSNLRIVVQKTEAEDIL